jgi:hypothetical protein
MSRLGGGRTWWAHLEFTRINIKPTIRKKEIEDARGSGELLSRSGTPRLLDDPAAISCGMTVTVAEARGRQSSR